jgi:predicted DNA-binding protein (MmcQ/YjbR family)
MKTDRESLRLYCKEKKESTESYPWKNKRTLGFKVRGKLFAAIDEDKVPLRLNLKCDPGDSSVLKKYNSIVPHPIHPKSWITILLDDSVPHAIVLKLIDRSYELVVKSLKREDREGLLG